MSLVVEVDLVRFLRHHKLLVVFDCDFFEAEKAQVCEDLVQGDVVSVVAHSWFC